MCPDLVKEWCSVELCRDCGHRNVGAIYCVKCGSALFRRKGRPETDGDDAIRNLTRIWSFFARRN